MKCYSAVRRSELSGYGMAWIKLSCLTLSERNQTQGYTLYVSIYMTFGKRQSYREQKTDHWLAGTGLGESMIT